MIGINYDIFHADDLTFKEKLLAFTRSPVCGFLAALVADHYSLRPWPRFTDSLEEIIEVGYRV